MELPQFTDANLLTNSSVNTFFECQRKYFLKYEIGLRSIHNATPLRFGSAFHLGLEIIKNGCPVSDAESVIREAYAAQACPPYMDQLEYTVEEETVVAMVKAYAAHYAGDLVVKFIAVEVEFSRAIRNPATGAATPIWKSAGKIDGIVELPSGEIALIEHKTVGESVEKGSDYWNRLLMDGQISRYILAARDKWPAVSKVIYDVARKPEISPKSVTKKDQALANETGHYFDLPVRTPCPERETPKMYAARLYNDMLARPEFYFARMEIARLDDDLTEYEHELWTVQGQIRAAQLNARTAGAAAFPRNTSACNKLGRCQFFDICRGVNGPIDPAFVPPGFKIGKKLHEELQGEAQ